MRGGLTIRLKRLSMESVRWRDHQHASPFMRIYPMQPVRSYFVDSQHLSQVAYTD